MSKLNNELELAKEREKFAEELADAEALVSITIDIVSETRYDESIPMIQFQKYVEAYGLAKKVRDKLLNTLISLEMYR